MYQFKSLTFGLATAPRVYQNSVAPCSDDEKDRHAYSCQLGSTLVMAQTREILKSHMQTIYRWVTDIEFQVGSQCFWEPLQAIDFLRFLVHSTTMKIIRQRKRSRRWWRNANTQSTRDQWWLDTWPTQFGCFHQQHWQSVWHPPYDFCTLKCCPWPLQIGLIVAPVDNILIPFIDKLPR